MERSAMEYAIAKATLNASIQSRYDQLVREARYSWVIYNSSLLLMQAQEDILSQDRLVEQKLSGKK